MTILWVLSYHGFTHCSRWFLQSFQCTIFATLSSCLLQSPRDKFGHSVTVYPDISSTTLQIVHMSFSVMLLLLHFKWFIIKYCSCDAHTWSYFSTFRPFLLIYNHCDLYRSSRTYHIQTIRTLYLLLCCFFFVFFFPIGLFFLYIIIIFDDSRVLYIS